MGSRQTLRLRLVQFYAVLMCVGAGGVGWFHESARFQVLALLLLAIGFVLASEELHRWGARPVAPQEAGVDFDVDPRSMAQRNLRTLLVESQLEHAPVALFLQQAQGSVEALNNAARRLLAPGGAADRPDFLMRLAEAAQLSDAGPGRRSVFGFESDRGTERCLLACRSMVIQQAQVRFLALMPVESELEAETLKAWRQLVHILTHEIMNSLTPIASLSRTALDLVAEANVAGDGAGGDFTLALDTIARRADALAHFVSNYRRVSELPEPTLEPVALGPLLTRIEQWVGPDWRGRGGSAVFEVEPVTLSLMADAGQLEQVLLNLIKNAAQATAELERPRLMVRARLVRGGRLSLEVRDNGPGVPAGMEADIFLPFFSTKTTLRTGTEAGGQGIGLAVVRNLVHGMGGHVRYVKPVGGGASFVLSF